LENRVFIGFPPRKAGPPRPKVGACPYAAVTNALGICNTTHEKARTRRVRASVRPHNLGFRAQKSYLADN
jgi:hypothetical protein